MYFKLMAKDEEVASLQGEKALEELHERSQQAALSHFDSTHKLGAANHIETFKNMLKEVKYNIQLIHYLFDYNIVYNYCQHYTNYGILNSKLKYMKTWFVSKLIGHFRKSKRRGPG